MKRTILSIEIDEDQEAVLKHAARIINKESVSDYCRRKIFASATENASDYATEIKTLKADLEKLQSDKEDCDKKNKEQANEIATLKSDLEILQNNSKNTAIQKLAKQAQEIKDQAKQINALTEEFERLTEEYEAVSDEFIKLQDKKFVSPSDLHLELTPEEHTFVDLVMGLYNKKINTLTSDKAKGAIQKEIIYLMGKIEKYLPKEYQNPESAEYNLLTKLRDRLTLEIQSEN